MDYLQKMYRIGYILLLFILSSCAYRGTVQKEEEGEYAFQQGLRAYYAGDLNAASQLLEQAYKLDSRNNAACYQLCKTALLQQDTVKASEWIQKAVKLDPDNYWYGLAEAQLAVQTGQKQKACKLYEQLLEKNPQKRQLLYDMVNLYANEGDRKRTQELLELIETKDGQTEASVLMRFNLVVQEDTPKAFSILEDFLDSQPGSPNVMSVLADYYMGQGRLDEAQALYQQTLELDPSYMPAVFGEAEVYRMKRQLDMYFERINPFLASPDINVNMKTEYLRQLLDTRGFVATFQPQVDTLFFSARQGHPADSTLAYLYGQYLMQTGRPDLSVAVFIQNVDNYPKDKDAWYQAIAVLYYRKMWPQVVDYAHRALEVFPKDIDFTSLYGMALWQNGDLPAAVTCLEELLTFLDKKDKANRIQTLTLLGDLYHELNMDTKSFHYYESVLKEDPNNVAVLNNYAYFLCLQNNDLEKALRMSKQTIEIEPNNATYLDTYGWILYLLGRYPEAKDIFRQAMAYGGKESAEILNHYGDVLNALNEPLMAIVYWQQAYALEPRPEIDKKIKTNRQAAGQ